MAIHELNSGPTTQEVTKRGGFSCQTKKNPQRSMCIGKHIHDYKPSIKLPTAISKITAGVIHKLVLEIGEYPQTYRWFTITIKDRYSLNNYTFCSHN